MSMYVVRILILHERMQIRTLILYERMEIRALILYERTSPFLKRPAPVGGAASLPGRAGSFLFQASHSSRLLPHPVGASQSSRPSLRLRRDAPTRKTWILRVKTLRSARARNPGERRGAARRARKSPSGASASPCSGRSLPKARANG